MVAQYADGCNVFGDVPKVRHLMDVLEGHCEKLGRDPGEITKTRNGVLFLGRTHEEAQAKVQQALDAGTPQDRIDMAGMVGGPDEIAELVQSFLDAGLDGVTFSIYDVHDLEIVRLAGETIGAVGRHPLVSCPHPSASGASRRSRAPCCATSRSPSATRSCPPRSRCGPARARTGARSPPGPRARPGGRSAERTRSTSCRRGWGATASCCTRCGGSAGGCCGAGSSSPRRAWAGCSPACTRRSTRSSAPSGAVARGNLKVFAEIGLEFARYLEEVPEDAAADSAELRAFVAPLPDRLRTAFSRYQQERFEEDPKVRTELLLLANLEIGCHEQERLQPEILEALDAPFITFEDLGARLLPPWLARRPRAARLAGRAAAPLQRALSELAREGITHSLMVLSLPGRILALGTDLPDPYPEALRVLVDVELHELVAGFEPASGLPDHSGAHDWADFRQRMHYIVHLFRVFHATEDLLGAPFTPEQVQQLETGVIPSGDL